LNQHGEIIDSAIIIHRIVAQKIGMSTAAKGRFRIPNWIGAKIRFDTRLPVHDRSSFENLYAGQPRWEIGRPKKAILEVADQITGSILDSGCGTGEIALHFASWGHKVTGIDFLSEPIQQAKQKATERGVTATFLVMDALAFPKSSTA